MFFDGRFRRATSGGKLLAATLVASVALSSGTLAFEPARAQAESRTDAA